MVCGVHDEVYTYHHSQFQTSRETPPPLAIILIPVTLFPWYHGEDVPILGCIFPWYLSEEVSILSVHIKK